MNIGIVVGRFPPDHIGGAELQARSVAKELALRGHSVTVFTRKYGDHPRVEKIDGFCLCRRRVVSLAGLRFLWDVVAGVRAIWSRGEGLDILLCFQTLNSGLIGVVFQKVSGMPVVIWIRGNREYRTKDSVLQRMTVPFILSKATRVLVQSAHIRRDMMERLRADGVLDLEKSVAMKTGIVPNGIDVNNFMRSSGSKVVFLGRLIRDKGVDDLISAMKKVEEAELVIVGDGPARTNLEKMARNRPITFTGLVEPQDIPQWLGQARVFVMPSRIGDGLPNVILEAMASGVPVVATRTAGIPDLVKHGRNGYLCDVGDIEAMGEYIQRLVSNDELWGKLADAARATAKRFVWSVVTPKLEEELALALQQAASKKGATSIEAR